MARTAALETLPLFATDRELGVALLGAARVKEWCSLAPALEERGLPRVDGLMGGRYVPAVKAFFDRQYGLGEQPAAAPDGGEDLTIWANKRKRRA